MALQKLGPSGEGDIALPWDSIKEALDHMAESSANYVAKENFLVFWDSLQVENVFMLISNNEKTVGYIYMHSLFNVIHKILKAMDFLFCYFIFAFFFSSPRLASNTCS